MSTSTWCCTSLRPTGRRCTRRRSTSRWRRSTSSATSRRIRTSGGAGTRSRTRGFLLDRSGGELAAAIGAQTTLTDAELQRVLRTYLDGYINFGYRSLKSHRDGRTFEARLDAVESLPWVLPVVFALHHRVRPYNKYLRWELTQHPLAGAGIDGDVLLGLLDRIVDDGDPAAQRALFSLVEPPARRAGHGDTMDAWGTELSLFT